MQLMMDRFTEADLPAFFSMASQEGWICDQWEFDFLLREAPDGCRAILTDSGIAACVTAIAYGRQGWIGNLIVAPTMRRQGLGRRLMEESLTWLRKSGVTTVWLTASQQGASLYESLGFEAIDRIERWVGIGRNGTWVADRPLLATVASIDANGWGGSRTRLLMEKMLLGQVFRSGSGYLVGQNTPSGYQLGPGGGDLEAMPELLDRVLIAAGGGRVFLDLPAGNAGAGAVLDARGFSCCGEALLMCRGDASGYHADRIWALATMGSIG